jgi:hypothetical protein
VPGGGPDPGRGHRARPGEISHRRGGRRVPAAAQRGRWLAQGAMPVPRREDPVVQRHPGPRPVVLLLLRRGRRRHQVRAEDRQPVVRRGGGTAGRPGRPRAPLRAGRPGSRPGAQPAAQADRGAPGGGGILYRTPARGRCRRGARVPRRAGFRAGRRGAVRRWLRPGRVGGADQASARPWLHRAGTAGRGAGHPGPPRRDGPVPEPAHLADPRPDRRRDRVRRAQAQPGRGRPQVPEHAGDPAVQEEFRAVWRGPGQAGHRAAPPGGHRRPPPAPRSARTTSRSCAGC